MDTLTHSKAGIHKNNPNPADLFVPNPARLRQEKYLEICLFGAFSLCRVKLILTATLLARVPGPGGTFCFVPSTKLNVPAFAQKGQASLQTT
jgi:hypothetical protein